MRQRWTSESYQTLKARRVQRLGHTPVDHTDDLRLGLRLGRCLLLCTQPRPLLAIQHIGSRHIMLTRAHETKFDLVLNVFYVQGAAAGLPTHESVDDQSGKPGDLLANARRSSSLATVDREESFGHGNRDLSRLEAHHGAVAPDDLVLTIVRITRRAFVFDSQIGDRGGDRGLSGQLH